MATENGTSKNKELEAKTSKGQILASTQISITPDNVPAPKEGTKEDHKYKEFVRKYKIVPWYGQANEFATVLGLLYENSVTHRSCIQSKITWTVGDGLVVNPGKENTLVSFGGDKPEKTPVPDADQETILEFIERANPDQDVIEVLREGIESYLGFGNGWVELQRGYVEKTPIFNAFVQDPTHCLNTKRDKDGIRYVLISPDWSQDYLQKHDPVKIPHFPVWEKGEDGLEHTCIYVKHKAPRRDHYGVPASIASITEQEIEHETAIFNKDNFDSGFLVSAILTLFAPSGMTKGEAEDLVDGIEEKFTKKGKRRGPWIQVVESESMKHELTEFKPDVDGDFLELDKRIEKKIVRSHQWYEILIGNPTPGSLGQTQEMRNAALMALGTVIKPLQNVMISKFLSPIFREWGLHMGKKGIDEKYYFTFSNSLPISFFGDIDVNRSIRKNEAREVLGLASVEDDWGNEQVRTSKDRDGNTD